MKLQISKSVLQEKLNIINPIIPSRSTKPIAECILMELIGNDLKMTATDLSLIYTTTIKVEGGKDGAIIIPGKQFSTIIKGLPEGEITLEKDGTILRIKIGAIKFKVAITENTEEFPAEPDSLTENSMKLDSLKLRSVIEKTIFASSIDELRAVLTGVLFSITEDSFIAVATDSVRLVKLSDLHLDYTGKDLDVIIPSRSLRLIQNSIVKNEPCEVLFSELYIQFNFSSETIFARLINGRYPAYQSIIPKNNNIKVEIDKSNLVNALSRIAITTNPLTSLIKLSFSENSLMVESEDSTTTSSAKELLSIPYDGVELKIGFHVNKLLDVLKHIETDKIILSVENGSRPVLIHPTEDSKIYEMMALVMPVKIIKKKG